MKMKMLKNMGVAILVLGLSSSAFAGTIALWDYNAGSFAPSIGSGSMSYSGGLSASQVKWDTDLGDYGKVINGYAENNSTDPKAITNPGTPIQSRGQRAEWGKNAWSSSAQPGSKKIIWNVSTAGVNSDDIKIKMDVRIKPFDPKYFQIQYTTDGINWSAPEVFQAIDGNGDLTIWNNAYWDLSGKGINNCANFAIAFTTAYASGQNAYEAASTGFTYDPVAEPWFKYGFDMVEVYSGTSDVTRVASPFAPVPEPGTLVALSTGLVGLAGLARKRTR